MSAARNRGSHSLPAAILRAVLTAAACAVMLSASVATRQSSTGPQSQRALGGDYETLSDAQRALVDDLYKRAGVILGVTLDPEAQYNAARLSVRTTFDAVTHALSHSPLTDRDSGQSLGAAIDLVDHTENVAGQVRGAPGDHQFRLYVVLKPGSRQVLERSKEFRRTADNTIFHKGYPISYRQEGYPSVQFSMTVDGSQADIDVDYRSSRFPAALVNGHLTAANSDVRAGNFSRHNDRWSGLVNWWDGFLSALFSAKVDAPDDVGAQTFPPTPRAGKKTIDVAVGDFLTSWLVEDKPNLSVAYVDPDAYECLAMRLDLEGRTLDRGLAPLEFYARMKRVNDALGPRTGLEGTTKGVRLLNPGLKLAVHEHQALYSIYAISEAMADQLSCASYTEFGALPAVAHTNVRGDSYRSYYSAFVIIGKDGSSVSLGLVWRRRGGQWKIVSYQLAQEAVAGTKEVPDLRKPVRAVTVPRMQADATLVAANEKLLEDWLVRKRYGEVFAAVSPRCWACANLYLEPGESPKATPEEQGARLRRGIERLGERVGRVERLEDVIKGVEPFDPRFRLVEHRRSAAFGLIALPDWAGPASECETRLAHGDDVAGATATADAGYGHYFATALQFVPRNGETAVLLLAWERDEGRWKVFAYKVVVP